MVPGGPTDGKAGVQAMEPGRLAQTATLLTCRDTIVVTLPLPVHPGLPESPRDPRPLPDPGGSRPRGPDLAVTDGAAVRATGCGNGAGSL